MILGLPLLPWVLIISLGHSIVDSIPCSMVRSRGQDAECLYPIDYQYTYMVVVEVLARKTRSKYSPGVRKTGYGRVLGPHFFLPGRTWWKPGLLDMGPSPHGSQVKRHPPPSRLVTKKRTSSCSTLCYSTFNYIKSRCRYIYRFMLINLIFDQCDR